MLFRGQQWPAWYIAECQTEFGQRLPGGGGVKNEHLLTLARKAVRQDVEKLPVGALPDPGSAVGQEDAAERAGTYEAILLGKGHAGDRIGGHASA